MGHIHITSGEDVFAPPDFVSSYLDKYVYSIPINVPQAVRSDIFTTSDADMELHVFAYKRAREFGRRMVCYRGEYPAQHPEFAKDSPAAVSEDPTPVFINAPDIVYTEEDNQAIRTFIRKFSESLCGIGFVISLHFLRSCYNVSLRKQNWG